MDLVPLLPTGRTGGYFEGGAQELLALHILAAACFQGDLLHVLGWLSHDSSPVPARILAHHSHEVAAMAMRKTRGLNPRQRDGLFDMARAYLRPLGEPIYAAAITPPRRQPLDHLQELGTEINVHDLPELDPATFATGHDTLYALSMEGRDSSSALTTALVGRIFYAAQGDARRSPGGRLPIPLVAVLDEAANICRLTELPDQYSHFGSQGIVVLTVLQSPAQARKVWSADQFAPCCRRPTSTTTAVGSPTTGTWSRCRTRSGTTTCPAGRLATATGTAPAPSPGRGSRSCPSKPSRRCPRTGPWS